MFAFEIWSSVDNRFNPSLNRYKTAKGADAAMTRYLEGAAENGWNTCGNVIELAIVDGALRQIA